MTPKQTRFVAEYLVDLNATQAAIRAGVPEKSAKTIGPRWLAHVGVAAAIAEGKAKQLEKADLSAARVLEEYRRISFLDVRTFYDEAGNLKPVKDWTADQGASVSSFEVLIKNAKAGDGVTDTVHKIRLIDKSRTLNDLSKHFGLLTERVDLSGELVIRHEGLD